MFSKLICICSYFLIYYVHQLIRLSKAARCPDGVILASLAKPSRSFAPHCLVHVAIDGNADGVAKNVFLFSYEVSYVYV
jgi:hypothetical protein